MFVSLLVIFLACTSALAAPAFPKMTHCDVSNLTVPMPSTQTSSATPLAAPIAGGPKFIALAVGVQNYTCSASGTYTSVGAVAELVDISCLPQSSWNGLTDMAFKAWKAAPQSFTASKLITTLSFIRSPFILGQHYFVTSPSGTGISPKWDFTSASLKGNSSAFVIAAKTGSAHAPPPGNATKDVDWLSLNSVQGSLASQIYRIETRGGQPPASCTPGSAPISVRYVSQYLLLGGSF